MKNLNGLLILIAVLVLVPSVSGLFISASWGTYYPVYRYYSYPVYTYPTYTYTYPTYKYTYPTYQYCGDGFCNNGETKLSCARDCGSLSYCGDGTCDKDETKFSCAKDCGLADYCGDGFCGIGEDRNTCPYDCGVADYCGDGTCNRDETKINCPEDCGLADYCGDGSCNGAETPYSCPNDCGQPPYCGDGSCNGAETKYSCPEDCGLAPYCGDGTCDKDETKYNCAQDCGLPAYCGDGFCNGLETKYSCPQDCGNPMCTNPLGNDGKIICEDRELLLCSGGFWEPKQAVQCCEDYDCPVGYVCSPGHKCVEPSVKVKTRTIYLPPVIRYYCGDGICSNGETQYSCPNDCGMPPICGDGSCNGEETQETCPQDCGYPAVYGVGLTKSDDCIEVVQGESGEFLITIQNTGNTPDTYSLSILGPTATWVQTSPLTLDIGNGETKMWSVTVVVPESVEPGLYDIAFKAESSNAQAETSAYVDVRLPPLEAGEAVEVTGEAGEPEGGELTPTATGAASAGMIVIDAWFLAGLLFFIIALMVLLSAYGRHRGTGRRGPYSGKEDLEKRLTEIADKVEHPEDGGAGTGNLEDGGAGTGNLEDGGAGTGNPGGKDIGELTPDGQPAFKNNTINSSSCPEADRQRLPGEIYWENKVNSG